MGLAGHPGGAGERVLLEVEVGVAGDLDAHPLPGQRPGRTDLLRPTGLGQEPGLHGPREAPHERGRLLLLRSQQQHVTRVRVGRALLGEQVVTVVPDDDEPEVVHRREGRGAGADRHLDRTPGDPEELPVARRGAGVGGQHGVPALPQHLRHRGVEPGEVLPVGHHDQDTTPGGQRRRGGVSDQVGVVGAGRGVPDRSRRPARCQVSQERGRRLVTGPCLSRGGGVERPAGLGGRRRLLLGRRVPRRDREPEHVRAGTGVAPGHRLAQSGHLRRQHDLRADDPLERLQLGVLGGLRPRHHEPVDVLGPEPHLHPHPGPRLLGHRGRDRVVEGPVQMGHRQVDQHLGDRIDLGGLRLGGLARTRGGGLRPPLLDPVANQPGQLQLGCPGCLLRSPAHNRYSYQPAPTDRRVGAS